MKGVIKTQATAIVQAPADTMQFRINASNILKTYEDSASKGSITCNKITDILKKAGANQEKFDIKINVEETYTYIDENGRKTRNSYGSVSKTLDGYTYTITVVYEDVLDHKIRDKVYIDLFNSGLNLKFGVKYWCENVDKYKKEAISKATESCRSHADAVAAASGATITGVSMADVDHSMPYEHVINRWDDDDMVSARNCYDAGPSIKSAEPRLYTPKDDQVKATVYVEWAIISGTTE